MRKLLQISAIFIFGLFVLQAAHAVAMSKKSHAMPYKVFGHKMSATAARMPSVTAVDDDDFNHAIKMSSKTVSSSLDFSFEESHFTPIAALHGQCCTDLLPVYLI